jgi:hypothetical protein
MARVRGGFRGRQRCRDSAAAGSGSAATGGGAGQHVSRCTHGVVSWHDCRQAVGGAVPPPASAWRGEPKHSEAASLKRRSHSHCRSVEQDTARLSGRGR